MDNLLAVVTIGAYAIALSQILPRLIQGQPIATLRSFLIAMIAVTLHGFLLKNAIFQEANGNLSLLNVASLVSFLISLSTTLAIFKWRIWFLLPTAYSFAILNILTTLIFAHSTLAHLETQTRSLLHISLALFSYSTLMIATLYVLQWRWLNHKLKQKKDLHINPNIPPLMIIEKQLFRLILLGNALLTITLMTGWLSLEQLWGTGKAHKMVLSCAAWVIYNILLWGYYYQGWRGRKITTLSLLGAILLTLAYFGSRFIQEILIHH
jgi:ABC-type uncharacterized transport system permease subunit